MRSVNIRLVSNLNNEPLLDGSGIPPLSTVIDLSRKHLGIIIKDFIKTANELLQDIAHHQKNQNDARLTTGLRQLLHSEQDHIIHDVVSIFVSAFISAEIRTNTIRADENQSAKDAYLDASITALRQQHATRLDDIQRLWPDRPTLSNPDQRSNPVDPANIQDAACIVITALGIDDNRNVFCGREFHSALKKHLGAFYDDVILALAH